MQTRTKLILFKIFQHKVVEQKLYTCQFVYLNKYIFWQQLYWRCGTYDLQFSHILFPPQKFGVFWSHGRHHVVEIHANVHEVVQQIGECRIATCENVAKVLSFFFFYKYLIFGKLRTKIFQYLNRKKFLNTIFKHIYTIIKILVKIIIFVVGQSFYKH